MNGVDERRQSVSSGSRMVPKQVIRECPVWGLSTPLSALGVRMRAWGSSGTYEVIYD